MPHARLATTLTAISSATRAPRESNRSVVTTQLVTALRKIFRRTTLGSKSPPRRCPAAPTTPTSSLPPTIARYCLGARHQRGPQGEKAVLSLVPPQQGAKCVAVALHACCAVFHLQVSPRVPASRSVGDSLHHCGPPKVPGADDVKLLHVYHDEAWSAATIFLPNGSEQHVSLLPGMLVVFVCVTDLRL